MPYKILPKLILRSPQLHFPGLKTEETLKISNSLNFYEALYLATPELASIAWNNHKINKNLLLPLYKYASRATTRCTPFGLFAGCTCVDWGDKSQITFENNKRTTRLDFEFIHSLINHLNKHRDLKDRLKYYPNNTIYSSGNNLRYIEYTLKDNKRWYKLSQAEYMPELSVILKCATKGANVIELSQEITSNEISFKEAKSFVYDLIENKLLLSELEPAVTGGDYLIQLIQILLNFRDSDEINDIINTLKNIQLELNQLDESLANDIDTYNNLQIYIKQLNIPFKENRILQTDLLKKTKAAKLDKSIQKALKESISALLHFAEKPGNYNLQSFTTDFSKRYGAREVPLLNALDTETGLGYPVLLRADQTPLIENIALPIGETNSRRFNEKDKIYLEILQKAHLFNEYSVDIKKYLSNKPKPNWDNLPPSFSAMFRVTNFETNEIFLESAGGSSAIKLLGRFAHTDKQIHEITTQIAHEEQKYNPNVIFAEIAHNPENRTGNIISHPPFRDYEIPIVSPSNPNVLHSIALSDLLLSVRNNRIILRSKKIDKEIIPRLSNAHNFSKSELPIYRFLCDLQTQDNIASLSFNWGSLSDNFLFLPRVTHDNAILSLATWKLPKSELLILTKNKNAYSVLPEFLKKWKIPNQVVIADRDNELFIDFSNDLSVKVFFDVLRKKEKLVLKEFLFDENTPIIDEMGKKYTNQFIASFVKDEPVYKGKSYSHKSKIEAKREFIPGSNWVYLKYYCGTNTADNLLSDMIKPIADKSLKEQIINKWFFIRYRDEDEHLRVRFHLTDNKFLSEVLKTTSGYSQKYIDQGLIWKVQTDTYIREIERYGAETMELSEQLFFYDSEVISFFLSSIDETTDTNIQWLWGMKAIDTLMNCFGLELEDKKKLMEQLKIAFANEFQLEKPSKLQIDKNYRKYAELIYSALVSNSKDNPLHPYLNIIEDYQINILKIAPEIISRTSNSSDLWDYLKSYIHMHINRLLNSSQRLNEMVIYDYMYRYYRSKMVRAKNKSIT